MKLLQTQTHAHCSTCLILCNKGCQKFSGLTLKFIFMFHNFEGLLGLGSSFRESVILYTMTIKWWLGLESAADSVGLDVQEAVFTHFSNTQQKWLELLEAINNSLSCQCPFTASVSIFVYYFQQKPKWESTLYVVSNIKEKKAVFNTTFLIFP